MYIYIHIYICVYTCICICILYTVDSVRMCPCDVFADVNEFVRYTNGITSLK